MHRSLLLAASALLLASTAPLSAQAPATGAQAAPTRPVASKVLEDALNNMSRLRGFHVDAIIVTPIGKAKVDGDLGQGSLAISVTLPSGKSKQRVLVDKQFYLSADAGKTWKTGKDAESDFTIFFSNVLTTPIDPRSEIWNKATFNVREVTVNGETLLHLEKPAQGKEHAVNYWLCKEPELNGQVFVRRLTMTVAASDGEFPLDVTYSRLAKTVSITAPVR